MTKVELSLAAQLLVQAYRQCIAVYQYDNEELRTLRFQVVAKQAEAPQDLTGVRAAIEAGLLPIAEEHSDHSIYGVRGNVVFRAWHDLGHYLYGLEMHADDEQKLAVRQWDDIERFIPAQYREMCKRVYLADTVGQTLLCAFSGEFPKDQREFVQWVLSHGDPLTAAVSQYIRQAPHTVSRREFLRLASQVAELNRAIARIRKTQTEGG